MALNNIGAAHIMLGRFTEAERVLGEALDWDREAPLAHFNLALAAQAQGKDHAAQQHLHRARELGYAGATSDRLVHSPGVTLAKLEGQGVSRT